MQHFSYTLSLGEKWYISFTAKNTQHIEGATGDSKYIAVKYVLGLSK